MHFQHKLLAHAAGVMPSACRWHQHTAHTSRPADKLSQRPHICHLARGSAIITDTSMYSEFMLTPPQRSQTTQGACREQQGRATSPSAAILFMQHASKLRCGGYPAVYHRLLRSDHGRQVMPVL